MFYRIHLCKYAQTVLMQQSKCLNVTSNAALQYLLALFYSTILYFFACYGYCPLTFILQGFFSLRSAVQHLNALHCRSDADSKPQGWWMFFFGITLWV